MSLSREVEGGCLPSGLLRRPIEARLSDTS